MKTLCWESEAETIGSHWCGIDARGEAHGREVHSGG